MPKTRKSFAILFADIAQTTKLYDRHGDAAAQRMVSDCFSVLKKTVTDHNGRVIKTIGDEIMCLFPTAAAAVAAAKTMSVALESISWPSDDGTCSPGLYIGIHYGPVIVHQGDIFGDTVNVAARMVSLAKQGQIIVTQETVAALPNENRDGVRCIDKTKIKGKSKEMRIYEVLCAKETATVIVTPKKRISAPAGGRLKLKMAGRCMEVNDVVSVKTLGRQKQNDIVVNDHRVSRSHARIECRKGRFLLVDQSTNGTYVTQKGRKRVLIRRDEMVLKESGVIGLYDEMDEGSADAIHYVVKEG